MKIIVGITGASGANLGVKLANLLPNLGHETSVILSDAAKISLEKEGFEPKFNEQIHIYSNDEIYAPMASGSAKFDKMIVAPCSINSLAKISCGIAESLILRACAVMLKEKRELILGVRETPFSTISLMQMAELSKLGVIIAPPVYGAYSGAKSIDELENFIIGKWLDLLGVEHKIYKRWGK